MTLQTDLTNSRAQLESTRTQLRASARAVESLTRAIEDLKEGKERSRLELQAMSTTLSRRERMLEETLSRARSAESSNRSLEDEKKLHYGECTKKIKDLELRCREAEERRGKAESEYQALRSAAAGLGDGFKKEIKMLKKELNTARLKGEQERNDAKTRQQSGEHWEHYMAHAHFSVALHSLISFLLLMLFQQSQSYCPHGQQRKKMSKKLSKIFQSGKKPLHGNIKVPLQL